MTIYLVNLLLIGSVMFLSTRYHETTHGKGIYLTKRWGLVVVTILLGGLLRSAGTWERISLAIQVYSN